MIVIKLGGRLITQKNDPKKIRENLVKRLCEEIAPIKQEIILIHGSGYLGRHLINQYGLKGGLKSMSQLKGFHASSLAIQKLNNDVVSILNKVGRISLGFRPYHLIITNNDKIEKINLEIIKRTINLGITPIMCGDIVLDREKGFSILSGDQIATYIAKLTKAQKLIFVTDVDGLFNEKGKLVKDVSSFKDVSKILSKGKNVDISGGMLEKIREIIDNAPCDTWIINGLEKGRLSAVLRDKEVIGTKIIKK